MQTLPQIPLGRSVRDPQAFAVDLRRSSESNNKVRTPTSISITGSYLCGVRALHLPPTAPRSPTLAAGLCRSSSDSMTQYKDNYSLWLMPEAATAEKVSKEINTQAQQYAGPLFLPHVTLIPDINGDKEELKSKSAELVAKLKKLQLNILDVATGASYHQCVYLLCDKTPDLVEAATLARSTFGKEGLPFKPHMSLLYADITPEQRRASAAEAVKRLFGEGSGYDTLLPDNKFTAVSLALWYTPVEDKSLESWVQVAEWPLQG